MSTVDLVRCPECEQDMPRSRLCPLCGTPTILVQNPSTSASSAPEIDIDRDTQRYQDMEESRDFSFLDTYIRGIMEESLQQIAPSKQISQDYLANLGKVVLDETRGILHDTTLNIGPLRILAVPGAFSPMELDHYPLTADLVSSKPLHGESQLETNVEGKIVRMERGKVSFMEKALTAQSHGAKAVVITQSAPVWPFVMTDSSANGSRLSIPVFMISQKDGLVVDKLMGASKSPISASLHVYEIAFLLCGCVLGEEILKLHCRHCYHTACVMGWLEGHNTCPMCRHQMPKEEDEKDKQRNVEAVNSFFG